MKTKKLLILFLFTLFLTNIYSEDYKQFFIESLRSKKFKNNELKIERTVNDNNAFTSYIASYYSDNLKLFALLNIPKVNKQKIPVIILNHGHIPPKQYSTITSYQLVSNYFAQSGFIVLKPDYRGHDKSEGNTDDRLSRMSYPIDVLNLLYALPSLKNADPDNVFIYGHSMGGQVTLTVLEVYNKIKAATLWAPVSNDFPDNTLYYLKKRGNKDELERFNNDISKIYSKDDYKKLSVGNYLNFINVPILLHHGTLDDSVPYQWSMDLIEKFKKNNIKYKFYSYTDDHNFAKGNFYTVLKRDVEFFRSYIK